MLLVNTDYISGKELETLGIVKGSIVQTKNFGKDFMAGIKNLVGGGIFLSYAGSCRSDRLWNCRKVCVIISI